MEGGGVWGRGEGGTLQCMTCCVVAWPLILPSESKIFDVWSSRCMLRSTFYRRTDRPCAKCFCFLFVCFLCILFVRSVHLLCISCALSARFPNVLRTLHFCAFFLSGRHGAQQAEFCAQGGKEHAAQDRGEAGGVRRAGVGDLRAPTQAHPVSVQ